MDVIYLSYMNEQNKVEEVKMMGSAKVAENLSEEDKFLMETKSDDELRELDWKQCTKCLKMRPPKLFYKSSRRNQMSYTCRICHRQTIRAYRNVPDTYNYFYRRLEKQRTKARKRGLEYSLTVDDYKTLKEQEFCFYCKDIMEVVTIDRVDNDKGYIPENVVAVCYTCNKVKSVYPFTTEEMFIIGKAIKSMTIRTRKLAKEMPVVPIDETIT